MTLRAAVALLPAALALQQPHLFLIVGDDVGWNSVGYHDHNPEVLTPRLDKLAREGAIFQRMYAYMWCSPSRAALMSGRFPHHVYQEGQGVASPDAGLPLEMTTLAERLRAVGYDAIQAGKWHLGFARRDYLPVHRGFNLGSFGYFGGAEDHLTQHCCTDALCLQNSSGGTYSDMWLDERAARELNNTGVWGDDRWTAHVARALEGRDAVGASPPLFAYLALGAAHTPLQAPDEELSLYDDRAYHDRRVYNAMMSWLDRSVGTLVDAIDQRGLWSHSLVAFVSDNGGPVYWNNPDMTGLVDWRGGAGSNNYPLRGGKLGVLEGGQRVPCFLAGGALPAAARARRFDALASIADLHATLSAFGGARDLTDPKADAAGLPPVDGADLTPVLEGAAIGVRETLTLALNATLLHNENTTDGANVSALVHRDLKIILGDAPFYFDQAPVWPTDDYAWVWDADMYLRCGAGGCLFNLTADPSETTDLARTRPDDLARLRAMLARELEHKYEHDSGPADGQKYVWSRQARGDFIGPFEASVYSHSYQ